MVTPPEKMNVEAPPRALAKINGESYFHRLFWAMILSRVHYELLILCMVCKLCFGECGQQVVSRASLTSKESESGRLRHVSVPEWNA